jgi:hypothetical protein
MKKIVYFCFGLLAAISLSVAVAQNTQVLLGIGVGNDGTSSEVTDKASGDVLTAGEFNRLIRILRGFILDPDPDGKPRYVIGADGSSGVQNVGGGVLTVDVEGKLGATEYCDGDGGNCKAFADLGSTISFVGLSARSTGSAGGYNGGKNLCENVETGAKVCTVADLTQVLGSGDVNFTDVNNKGLLGQIRVQQGAPGYIQTLSNDCQGWSSANAGVYSPVLITASEKFLIQDCSKSLEFACCK